MRISESLQHLIQALEDIEDPRGAEIRKLQKHIKDLKEAGRTSLSNSESAEL